MPSKTIVIETSARHVHLTQENVEVLFGKGATLTPKKYLSQPGQFASEERVDIVGPKNTIPHVSVLGPVRSYNQVEVSLTDARKLGLQPPVRESGNIKGSAPIKIVGPKGELNLTEGVIIAKRHIHFTPEDAEKYGVKNKQIVKVKVNGERALIFDEVIIRVTPTSATFMHIDVDEANAAGLSGKAPTGEIID